MVAVANKAIKPSYRKSSLPSTAEQPSLRDDTTIQIRAADTFDRLIGDHMHDIELAPHMRGQWGPPLDDSGGSWVFKVAEVKVTESSGRPLYSIYSSGRIQGVNHALCVRYALDAQGQPAEPTYLFSRIRSVRDSL